MERGVSLWSAWEIDLKEAGNDSSGEFDSPAQSSTRSLASAGWRRSFSTPARLKIVRFDGSLDSP